MKIKRSKKLKEKKGLIDLIGGLFLLIILINLKIEIKLKDYYRQHNKY